MVQKIYYKYYLILLQQVPPDMKRLYGGALHIHKQKNDVVMRYPRNMGNQPDIVDSLTPCEEFSVYMALQGEHAPVVLYIDNNIIYFKFEQGNIFKYNTLDNVCLSYLSYIISRIHSLQLPVPIVKTDSRLYGYKTILKHYNMLYPPLKTAIVWLHNTIPNIDLNIEVCLHGDYKCDNIFDTGVVLDWEFAHMGDMHEDLAWFLLDIWHKNMMTEQQKLYFISEYEHRTGKQICFDRLYYWTIFSYVRFATIACQQYNRSERLGSLDLHMTGWRVHEIAQILSQQYGMGAYKFPVKTHIYPTYKQAIKCFFKNAKQGIQGQSCSKNLQKYTKKAFKTYVL